MDYMQGGCTCQSVSGVVFEIVLCAARLAAKLAEGHPQPFLYPYDFFGNLLDCALGFDHTIAKTS